MKCFQTGIIIVLLTAVFTSLPFAAAADREKLLFGSRAGASVHNKPSAATQITLTEPGHVTRIVTFHWNYGLGATPGTISIVDQKNGKVMGSWKAVGTSREPESSQGGAQQSPPFLYWSVRADIDLPAGSYEVVDSDPSSWSTSSEIGNKGYVMVYGQPERSVGPEAAPVAGKIEQLPYQKQFNSQKTELPPLVIPQKNVMESLNPDVLAGGRPGGDVLATKALMRTLVGPLDPEQEKSFNARYASAYANPTPKVANRHKKLNKSLISAITERELMLQSLREYDASMEQVAIAEAMGDQESREEALSIADINSRMLQLWAANLKKYAVEAAKADQADKAENPELPQTAGSQAYRDAVKATSEATNAGGKEPVDAGYLGKWVQYKNVSHEAISWTPAYIPKHTSSISESNATAEFTFLDHGMSGRHQADEELHRKLKMSWQRPPQEVYVYSDRSKAAANPAAKFVIKGSIEQSVTYSPADYGSKPYAPFDRTRAHLTAEIRLTSKEIPGNDSGWGSAVSLTGGKNSASVEINRDPAKTKHSDTFEAEFTPDSGSCCNDKLLLGVKFSFYHGYSIFYYKWVPPQPKTEAVKEVVLDRSLDAEKNEAISEHLTNIHYAEKAIAGYRQDLANAIDAAVADRIRFNIVHLEQDIHDSKDLIESIKTGRIVHTRGPWEQHAEAVAAQKSRELAETARRGQQMQASALKMAKVLGQYSPEEARKAHELVLKQISTGLYQKGGVEKAQKALAEIYVMTNASCRKAQNERVQEQEIAAESADRAARNLRYVEGLKKGADTAVFIGTMFTPMGPGAVVSIAYEGATVGVEKGPLEALKVMAKDAAAMAAMAGAMKGGQALYSKFVNPKSAANVKEAFAAAKFQEEMKFNQALAERVKETQAAVSSAHKAGATAEQIAMREAAAAEAVSAANSSTLAKRILKNELNQAQEGFNAAKKQFLATAGNPEAAKIAKANLAEAGRLLREQKGLHLGFQTSLDQITSKVDSKMIANLRAKGYNVEPSWFRDFRNATSVGINGDRDLGLLRQFETKLMKTNPATGQKTPVFHLETFMQDAQKEYESSYKLFNNGRSAKLADQNITTSWHSEAFPLEFLDSEKVGTATSDACRRAGNTIYNKVTNALAGTDPEFVNMQKAYASLSKDLKTKVLPVLAGAKPKGALTSGALEKAGKQWEEVAHVMDDFAKGRIDPIDATNKVRELTGGKTITQVAEDVRRVMAGNK